MIGWEIMKMQNSACFPLFKQASKRNLNRASSRKRHTHSVPHTLHIGNNKIKTKRIRKVVLWEGVLSLNPYLSTEYYTHSAVTLHPKYTTLFKHPKEICSESP